MSEVAEIYFYEEMFPGAGKLVLPVLSRFGVQVVLGDDVRESKFLNSGDLKVDRDNARWYGENIARELKIRGASGYNLHVGERRGGIQNPTACSIAIDLISSDFEEAVEEEFRKAA
ncbi:hypothetical protein FJZ19_04600 [Candidatus Pacearchaeota archaeon]|nr:hypothetical protein [Candidatus Pacearchaeota archaeon]